MESVASPYVSRGFRAFILGAGAYDDGGHSQLGGRLQTELHRFPHRAAILAAVQA